MSRQLKKCCLRRLIFIFNQVREKEQEKNALPTFQCFSISTLGSLFILATRFLAWCGVSRDIAPISATLNRDDRWELNPSDSEYPYKFGLYSFRILGIVKNSLHVFCPPMVQDSPLFSVATWTIWVAKPPFPAVKLSPIAPTMSISPGRNWCTDVGGVRLLLPGPLTSQKKGSAKLNCFCSFWEGRRVNCYLTRDCMQRVGTHIIP